MSKCSDAIRIVQFMHPGGEMKPHDAKKEDIPWNKILKQKCGARGCSGSCGGHKRKFIKTYGDYVDNKYNLQHDQEIMFWGEYEPSLSAKNSHQKTNPIRKIFTPYAPQISMIPIMTNVCSIPIHIFLAIIWFIQTVTRGAIHALNT